MAVAAAQFFNHIDAFVDYRKTIYETSDETIRSNRIDLNLFEDFVKEQKTEFIDGPTVMSFQYHLKKQRNNSGPSINPVGYLFPRGQPQNLYPQKLWPFLKVAGSTKS